jgi:hypothetical protein
MLVSVGSTCRDEPTCVSMLAALDITTSRPQQRQRGQSGLKLTQVRHAEANAVSPSCSRTKTSRISWGWFTMLRHALLWILPLVATCHGAALSNSGQPTALNAAAGPEGLQHPGYVRMPLSRHKLNGTEARRRGCNRPGPPRTQDSRPLPPWCAAASQTEPTQAAPGSATLNNLVPRQTPGTYRWGWSHLTELTGGILYAMPCKRPLTLPLSRRA